MIKSKNIKIKRILSIAGSDCSSGAGIQADIKTINSLGGYCLTAISAVTSQNSRKVFKIQSLPSEIIISQIKVVYEDIGFDSVKIGMLPDDLVAKKIAFFFKKKSIPIVVDPVFVSTTGKNLVEKNKFVKCQEHLYAISNIITPNLIEAEVLTKLKIKDLNDMYNACYFLSQKTDASIFLKGGEIPGKICTDLFYEKGKFTKFNYKRIKTNNTHGTGCTLSSAIAFYLSCGEDPIESIKLAKKYILKTINNSPELGLKYGPLGH